uniref:Uncharacterized protein n=1 Tax=viral metagenome TaxID=1070528 RepID=A0A6C0I0G2_9ZZZZ
MASFLSNLTQKYIYLVVLACKQGSIICFKKNR